MLATWLALMAPALVSAYPLDGYDYTGIRRLEYYRKVQAGELRGLVLPPGARLPLAQVLVRHEGHDMAELPPPDPEMAKRIKAVLGAEADRYSVAVLDLTDPASPRYAEHNPGMRENVGSVGKILVAGAVFQLLADLYPDDIAARERVLKTAQITADDFIRSDHHQVPLWFIESERFEYRQLRIGDQGTLWEYLDWMLSASSNAAASMVMQQLLLMKYYGQAYPVDAEGIARFFADTTATQRGQMLAEIMERLSVENGIDSSRLRQGSFFTYEGKRRVIAGGSYGTTRELVKYLYLIESGQLVDAFSSREMKRLLYMTQRRIRYASHPALADAAMYFKSGSLYSCAPEPDFVCRKYMGNVKNFLASIAIVEAPAGDYRYQYLVAVMSNVLRVNSAVAHQTLSLRIHRMIEGLHATTALPPAPEPPPDPAAAMGTGEGG